MHSFKTHHHHHHPAAIRSSSTAGAVLPAARPQRPMVNKTLLSCQASRCHYDTLGVPPTASADDIKSAFRKLALQLHPDINTAPNATEHFKIVKVAYEVLSDPQQRAAYNRQRLQAQTSYTRSSRSTSTPSGGVEYVVYDYVEDIDETFEETAAAGFWGWYQKSGSWQSSWDNRQKRKRRQQQQTQQQQTQQQAGQQSSRQQQTRRQAAQQAQHRHAGQRQQARHQQQHATVQQMVSQLAPATLKMVRSLFGEDLERLDSLEDLVEVLDSLELLRTQGIDLDAIMFDNDSSASSSGGGTGGSSNSRGGSSASKASSSRARRSSSSSSRAGRSSGTSSSSRRGSAARAGRRQPGRHLPRFDELSAEELYELINSQTDRKTAKAARAWVQEQLAMSRMHPGVAGSLAFLLATDYVMADLEQPDPREFVFGEMFHPDSERYRGRARAGSPGDYVKYSSDGSSSEDDGAEVEGGWIDVDELLSVFDAWEQSDWGD